MIARCACGKLATWHYMPSCSDDCDGFYCECTRGMCDECVPRGCSCNLIDGSENSTSDEEFRDDLGRLLPCCEWDEEPHGVDDMADYSDYPVWERLVIEEYGE